MIRYRARLLVLLGLAAAACGSPTGPSGSGAQIVLIGRSETSLDQAAQSIRTKTGYTTAINNNATAATLVLFTVYAPDDPMPQLRTELDRLRGQQIASAAMLMTGTDIATDDELLQLVELEFCGLLALYIGRTQADRLVLLRANDPNLANKIQTLVALPATRINIVS